MFYMHEKCKISDLYVFQGNASGTSYDTKYYFTNRVVNIWNLLPSHRPIVSSPALATLKSRLLKHDFTSHLIVFTV